MSYAIAAFAIAVVVGIARVIVPRWLRRRRNQDILAARSELGLEPFNCSEIIPADQLPFKTRLLEQGQDRFAYNAMQGVTYGLHALLLDYQYNIDVSDENGCTSKASRSYTVAAFKSSEHRLPTFELRKKKLWFGGGNTKLGNAQFDKHFALTLPGTPSPSDLFRTPLIDFLVGTKVDPKWHMEANGSWLIFWMKQVDAKKMREFFQNSAVTAAGFFQNCGCENFKAERHAV